MYIAEEVSVCQLSTIARMEARAQKRAVVVQSFLSSYAQTGHAISLSTIMKVDAALLFLAFYAIGTQAFVSPKVVARAILSSNEPYSSQHHQQQHPNSVRVPSSSTSMPQNRSTRVTLRRFMYNLPPSGGGNDQNDLAGILTGLGTVAAIALFFASPLGTIFFAITNSLFLLALLFPILAIVAFQAWQLVFTLEGPCPNCGAPVRVLKDDEQPTLCLSCGTLLHKRRDGSGSSGGGTDNIIEVYDDSSVIYDEMEDEYFGGSAGSILDALWNQAASEQRGLKQQKQQSPSGSSTGKTESSKASQYRRERTVIDVDAEEE